MVPTVACVLALAFSIPLTSIIAIITFRRGLDPDILVYPILASINDIVVTSTFVSSIFLVLNGSLFNYVLAMLFLIILGITSYIFWKNRKIGFFIQTIKEGTAVVIMSSLFGSINGYFLSGMASRFQEHAGLVILYPALTNALGNIGSIVGSTKTTTLALGYVKSIDEELKSAVSDILKVEAVAIVMHLVFALVTYLLSSYWSYGADLMFLISVSLLTNLSTFLLIGFFALIIAYISFTRGLNPDNIVIPFITTTSDSVATLAITPVIRILNFLGVI